jgi:hypothetical protein
MQTGPDPVVRLNVGGKKIDVAESTLLRGNSQYFAQLLGKAKYQVGKSGAKKDDNGRLFVDYNPSKFQRILSYLRGDNIGLNGMTEEEKKELLQQAYFFDLQLLVEEIRDRGYNPEYLTHEDQKIRCEAQQTRAKLQKPCPNPADILQADQKYLVDLYKDGKKRYSIPLNLNDSSQLTHNSTDKSGNNRYGVLFQNCANQTRLVMKLNFARKHRNPQDTMGPPTIEQFQRALVRYSGPFLRDMPMDNLVIAGGSILHVLHHTQSRMGQSDLDLFVVSSRENAGEEAFQMLLRHFKNVHQEAGKNDLLVTRTRLAVTFAFGYPQRHIQLILRRYNCVAQVLLNFDIDCCQVAYDGNTVMATPAGMRALESGTNIADPEKANMRYEERLAKYGSRGFMVVVPGLDMTRVQEHLLGDSIFIHFRREMRQVTILPSQLATIGRKRKLLETRTLPSVNARIEVEERPIRGLAKLVALSKAFDSVRTLGTEPGGVDISVGVAAKATCVPTRGPNYLVSYRKLLEISELEFRMNWHYRFPLLGPPIDIVIPADRFGTNQDDSAGCPLLPYGPKYTSARRLDQHLDSFTEDHGHLGKLYVVHDFIRNLKNCEVIRPQNIQDAAKAFPSHVFTESNASDGCITRHLEFFPAHSDSCDPCWKSSDYEFDWTHEVYE